MRQRSSTFLSLTLAAACISLAGASALVASPPQEEQHHRPQRERGARHHGEVRGPMQALKSLDLTEEQREQVREIFEGQRTLIEPLHAEGRALREQMTSIEEQENPNAEELGTLMLQGRALRETIRSHHEAGWEQIRALLTTEQAEKLALLEEMRQQRRADRADRPGRSERSERSGRAGRSGRSGRRGHGGHGG